MSSKHIGIEEARARLGDLVTAAQQGTDIIITRNRRPAARLVAYRQEETMTIVDDQAHQEIVTGAEAAALRAVGIDADAIVETPDGSVTVSRADGSRMAVGYGGDGDDQWWSGARYDDDGEQVASYGWASVEDMAADVAAWWRRTALGER